VVDVNSFALLFALSLVDVFTYTLDASEVLDGPIVLSGRVMVDSELPSSFVLLLIISSFEWLEKQMKEKHNQRIPRNIFKNYSWQIVLLSVPICKCSICIKHA
jgi:hypothetical protein